VDIYGSSKSIQIVYCDDDDDDVVNYTQLFESIGVLNSRRVFSSPFRFFSGNKNVVSADNNNTRKPGKENVFCSVLLRVLIVASYIPRY
jgi:hypothetical protein